MPNWAEGTVQIWGEPENIENFCKLFIFEEEGEKEGKFFARTFIPWTWEDFKSQFLNIGTENFTIFPVDFAWSAYTCLIEGYPDGRCINLEEAVKEYDVAVEIETEEGGMMFTEYIHCDKEGTMYDEEEMEDPNEA